MTVGVDLFSRHAERMAVDALTDTRVVVVNGARQVGKSTLAKLIVARSPGARELYLDDQAVRAAAEADPSAFVRHDSLLMIDEIQRVPELLLAIKREVDRDTRPGRFLLTGSARLLGLKDLPDALPGRTETIELWPLSQGEIDSTADGFVDAVWAEEPVQLFHYRDRDQVEVDMVLEHAAGTVIGVEVKAAETVRAEDFRGLRHLANRLGDRLRAGIVLYAGEQQLSFGDRLAALPMAALWTIDSSAR